MHRIPLHLPTPSVLWDRSLPECVLFERTLSTKNVEETVAFMRVLDDEAAFYKSQCYGIAEDMLAKANSCIMAFNAADFDKGMFLINSIILRSPKDSPILACALKIRGQWLYHDCSFEYASNDYEMFLEVNQFTECPLDDRCEIVGNLIVCMYMMRQLVKAKKYLRLYQEYKAKLSPEILQKNCFVQLESRIKQFMSELNDFGCTVTSLSDTDDDDYSHLNKTMLDADSDKNTSSMFASMDIQKTDIIFIEEPILKSLNAPFVRCEVCYSLSQLHMYTCLECRYKTYCSVDCMEKDRTMHMDECFGFKQLTLILLDASGIYRIFRNVIKHLHDQVFNQKIFRKKKTAEEIWYYMLKFVNEIKLEKENDSLSFIKNTPLYKRLMDSQYSTLVVTAFRLAIFIDTKTELIETYFKKLTITPKQKLILVGSLLMRIHCNILLNSYDFEIGVDLNMVELQAIVNETSNACITRKNKSCVENLNEYFEVNVETDIRQRSLDILQSTNFISPNALCNKRNTQLCTHTQRILSTYKDNIAELYFNPEVIQTVMYGPTAGQPINPLLAVAMCSRLDAMTDVQRCYFLKRYARLFHSHYAEYFMQMSEIQVHQVLSLYLPNLNHFKHSCDPNVQIIVLENGLVIGKSLRNIKKGEQLYVSYKAHHMHHVRTERQRFLKRFNLECHCMYCELNPLDEPINIRQGIYCESCNGVEITPAHKICPKCHIQYSNLLTKYLTLITVFENKLTNELKSHNKKVGSNREIYIFHHIVFTHARKYFVPQNEYRIKIELKYALYLALENFAQQSYNLIMEIRDNILKYLSYAEQTIWFTYYADMLLAIKVILRYNVEMGLYAIASKMLIQLCDLGLYIVRGQVAVIDFYEMFDKKCPSVLDDLSVLLKWKDKITCNNVLALAKSLVKPDA